MLINKTLFGHIYCRICPVRLQIPLNATEEVRNRKVPARQSFSFEVDARIRTDNKSLVCREHKGFARTCFVSSIAAMNSSNTLKISLDGVSMFVMKPLLIFCVYID
ncbi:hypothetical protein OS493_005503 [Desmophyllum pertusum]|uniref:Uncharacterized protein n=1 Tax=Desmophyllum pertusum TaxID=174260 RepID=A0A9X0CMI6_9CNID|nr:hypothetical protein OS493_005503 [Desmophyllum pertusum]